MKIVSGFLAAIGVGLLTDSYARSSKDNKVATVVKAILGGACVAGAMVVSHASENGEIWQGHPYPYSQYPHGHLDCADGSTVFDPYHSQESEITRMRMFENADMCIRGIADLVRYVGNKTLTCFTNGTMG